TGSGRPDDQYRDERCSKARGCRMTMTIGAAAIGKLDRAQRDQLIVRYLPLAYRLARKYLPSGEPFEDLVQIASLGLVKAAERFDPDRGNTFMTFAVPTIVGEINRYLRDCTWPLHVNRNAKDRAHETAAAQRAVSAVLGRRPSVQELADHIGC